MRIGFIGSGNMAVSMIKRFVDQVPGLDLIVSDPVDAALENSRKLGVKTTKNNIDVVKGSDIIFIAVKPREMPKVLDEISQYVEGKSVISIAAGVNIDQLRQKLAGAKVTRIMPNINFAHGESLVAYAKSS